MLGGKTALQAREESPGPSLSSPKAWPTTYVRVVYLKLNTFHLELLKPRETVRPELRLTPVIADIAISP